MSDSKQMSARERINAYLDDNSFVEIGALVSARSTDFNMSEKDTTTDGVITGYGVVDGNLVYVYSQDVSVMNGSVGEMHAKKIAKIYDMAMKMGAPVVGFIDCAGLRLQEATDALNGFGEVYLKQSMASGVVPQLTAIFGNCGGGVAVVPALADFTFMVKESRMFVNSPNALEKNDTTKCDTATAEYQNQVVGSVDYLGEDDADVIAQMRALTLLLPSNNEDEGTCVECLDELNRENPELKGLKDTKAALAIIADAGSFMELKADFAKEMVTGFMTLDGMTIGAVANRSDFLGEDGTVAETVEPLLSADGAKKAAEFITFCDAFEIPVLSLVNVKGFKGTIEDEKNIAKASAKLIYAYANATVPKVTVVVGEAYGSAYLAMGSKHIGADMVYAYADTQVGMMDAKLAAKIMYADEMEASDNSGAVLEEKAKAYEELQTSPVSAAKRGYVDDIIEAAATRKRVIAAFEMLYTKREDRPAKKHGTI